MERIDDMIFQVFIKNQVPCWQGICKARRITGISWYWVSTGRLIPLMHISGSNNWYSHTPLTIVVPWHIHDGVIKWKHFPRYWPFVRGIYRSPVNSPHKGQWREALMFTLICARINGWVNHREAGDLRHHRAHYDVIVMLTRRMKSPDLMGYPFVRLYTPYCWMKQNGRHFAYAFFKLIACVMYFEWNFTEIDTQWFNQQ